MHPMPPSRPLHEVHANDPPQLTKAVIAWGSTVGIDLTNARSVSVYPDRVEVELVHKNTGGTTQEVLWVHDHQWADEATSPLGTLIQRCVAGGGCQMRRAISPHHLGGPRP